MRSPHESYRNVHRQGVRPDRAAAGPGGGDGEVVGRSATLFTAAFDQTTDVGTYVAMESSEGSLRGRPGSFEFAHSAMTSGSDRTAEFFTIVPTSGTGEGLVREEDAAVLGAAWRPRRGRAGAGTELASHHGVEGTRVLALRQGLSLMPMTDEVFDAVTDGGTEGALGFWRLPGGFEKPLARWSAAGPVAYVEAEYFGGTGEQRAAVWADGELVLGPLDAPTKKWFSRSVSPISGALRRLGASRSLGEDEFEAVGLDRHRNNDGWIGGPESEG